MSRTLACLLALTTGACIEDPDYVYGLEASSVELPRGVTRPIGLTSAGALPALSTFLIDVDDPALVTVRLSADQQRFELHAIGEGSTTVHLIYRDSVLHVPTTILPAATVSIALRPGDVSAPIGAAVSLAAIATNTADELVDVTGRALWTVEDPHVARLYSDGTLQAMSVGTTYLRAEVDGVVQTAPVAIVPAN
ncbi:MAG: hypothetical protein AB7T06_12575 [Kofleriaceae bacterium]